MEDSEGGPSLSSTGNEGRVELIPLPGLGEIKKGDDLAAEICGLFENLSLTPQDGDILVIAHKIVSKSEGRVVDVSTVVPSPEAVETAARLGKDPVKVEVILRETSELIRTGWPEGKPEGLMICRHLSGHVSCNAGVDESNLGDAGTMILLPEDPDESAKILHEKLAARWKTTIGIVISDTFGRPWRNGLVNVAIGAAGIPSVLDLRGTPDSAGRTMSATVVAIADELAAASGLVMGKLDRTPVVLVRGYNGFPANAPKLPASSLLRPGKDDIFT